MGYIFSISLPFPLIDARVLTWVSGSKFLNSPIACATMGVFAGTPDANLRCRCVSDAHPGPEVEEEDEEEAGKAVVVGTSPRGSPPRAIPPPPAPPWVTNTLHARRRSRSIRDGVDGRRLVRVAHGHTLAEMDDRDPRGEGRGEGGVPSDASSDGTRPSSYPYSIGRYYMSRYVYHPSHMYV